MRNGALLFRLTQESIAVPEKLGVAEVVGFDDAPTERVVFEANLRGDALLVVVGEARSLENGRRAETELLSLPRLACFVQLRGPAAVSCDSYQCARSKKSIVSRDCDRDSFLRILWLPAISSHLVLQSIFLALPPEIVVLIR
jgi:hypothetical protein